MVMFIIIIINKTRTTIILQSILQIASLMVMIKYYDADNNKANN